MRIRNYPPARPLLPGAVRLQAENDATDLRQWLGLGLAPIHDVTSLLEPDLGVRVHVRPLDGRVSGLFACDDEVGACILLNAHHPRARRAQTAAHELGHLTSSRQTPDVCRFDRHEDSRAERYADAFGRAFLTPARAVTHRFQDVTAGASRLTRHHVILLAHAFGVSREALVRRLEELELARGSNNIAIGVNAGSVYPSRDGTGNHNIYIGNGKSTHPTGSDNIYIGHTGEPGDSGVVRLGNGNTQTKTYLAGEVIIHGPLPGSPATRWKSPGPGA